MFPDTLNLDKKIKKRTTLSITKSVIIDFEQKYDIFYMFKDHITEYMHYKKNKQDLKIG